MTPYCADGNITIYCGDCREILPTVPAADVYIADPPYAETNLEWDEEIKRWQEIAYQIAAASCSLWCFGSFRSFWRTHHQFARWTLAQDIVWEKQNGSGIHVDRFRRIHELAAHFYKGKWADLYHEAVYTQDATKRRIHRKHKPTHYNDIGGGTYLSMDGGPRLERSILFEPNCHGSAEHPTQKPVNLIVTLLRYSARPQAHVVDPFAGSGSTAIACRRLNLSCTLIEKSEQYCEIAARRLRQRSLDLA